MKNVGAPERIKEVVLEKTTTAVILGGFLAVRGERVLPLDLDPYGSMTCYVIYAPDVVKSSSFNLFSAEDLKLPGLTVALPSVELEGIYPVAIESLFVDDKGS